MGYTTTFIGSIGLSRKLTLKEAQYLLEMSEEHDVTKERWGMNNYMQWVPTTTLDAIVWDGNEKFYDYLPLMERLCQWLGEQGVTADGELQWRGESASDIGTITVAANKVTSVEGKSPKAKSGKPLTMDALGKLALDSLAG